MKTSGDTGTVGVVGGLDVNNMAGRGVGGFYGLGLIGAGLSQWSPPVALRLAAFGAVQTVYGTIFGIGEHAAFAVDTPFRSSSRRAPGPVDSPTPK